MNDVIHLVRCNRCDYLWFPRTLNEPKVCPACNSPYWNKERVFIKKELK
jgi:predicted Zn-ribbon and HTH transcriptional regulator